ncbi:MAG: RelA/SpoT family protein [Burkholderiales bacterium]
MERAQPRGNVLATVVDLARVRRRGTGRPAEPPPPDLSSRAAQFESFNTSIAGYLASADVERIGEAYRYSELAHRGQMRASGEEYITHPLAVAAICASWKLDAQAILAALLHDVVEDTGITKKDIAEKFGAPVAELVDGVSKLDRLEFQSQEDAQAENFRKMLLAMARDVRVMLVKLADRLHNMRTLSALKSPKRRRIARETLEIHAPIANRLGLNQVYRELQDLSFANLYPLRFAVISRAIKAARGNRREGVGRILEAIQKALPEAGIQAQVFGREKHIYGIYRKMTEKHLSFSQVLDIYGFRIVVGDVAGCYLALGAMHGLYKPVPGKFKDYIAIPKVNGYQSLHTTLIGPYGTPIEVQVRTVDMHRIAEAGVAAHWLYKDEHAPISEVQQKTHQWLQSLLDIQNRSQNPAEFLEHVKVDLFPDEVYVFTPKGRIMSLPRGATAVDFAYNVHTDVGDTTIGVKINGEPMPLRTELKNGDSVEVLTHEGGQPNPAWLSFVRTGKARAHIRHYMKTRKYEESVGLGERLLRQALRAIGLGTADLESTLNDKTVRDAGAKSRRDLLADIGLGKRLAAVVARKFSFGDAAPGAPAAPRPAPMTISGTEGSAVQLATCCRPIPGDPIIGQISKGQGLAIHTHDCPTILKSRRKDPDNWVDVDWDPDHGRHFGVNIRVLVTNGRGILAKVAGELTATDTNITNVRTEDDETGNYANMEFAIEVGDRAHLARVMRALRRLQEVVRVARVRA